MFRFDCIRFQRLVEDITDLLVKLFFILESFFEFSYILFCSFGFSLWWLSAKSALIQTAFVVLFGHEKRRTLLAMYKRALVSGTYRLKMILLRRKR